MTLALTSKELQVLSAFNTYEDAEGTKSDLGVSWTDVQMLATDTGLSVKSVKGVVGSLVKKDLVFADNEDDAKNPALCLTEDGVDAFFANRPEEQSVEPAAEAAAPRAVKLVVLVGGGVSLFVGRKLVAGFDGMSPEAVKFLTEHFGDGTWHVRIKVAGKSTVVKGTPEDVFEALR